MKLAVYTALGADGAFRRISKAWITASVLFSLLCGTAHGLEIKSANEQDGLGGKAIALQLDGKFEESDGLKVRAFIAKLPADAPIVARFNAGGGSFQAAVSIGRFFHQLNVVTEVPAGAHCLSPCPLAFVGGHDPKGKNSWIKHSSARFGFTPFVGRATGKDYTYKDLNAVVAGTQQNVLHLMDYFTEVHADLDLLPRLYEDIPPSTVRYISDEDLLSLGVSIYDDSSNQLIEAQAIRQRLQQ
jgi:hypothetical protein